MKRNYTHASLTLGLLALTCAAACGSEPSPVLVGQFEQASLRQALTAQGAGSTEPSTLSDLRVSINDEERDIPLESDLSFAIQDLPTGELSFTIEIEGITGTMTISEVLPGEVIDIEIGAAPGTLYLRVARRQTPDVDDFGYIPSEDNAIEISGSHVVHHLDSTVYEEDIIISGDHVTLVGPDHYRCREYGRATLEGDLIISGDHVRVVNLEVVGRTKISGSHVKIYSPCKGKKRKYD